MPSEPSAPPTQPPSPPSPPIYCVLPVLANPAYTRAAIADLLAQSVPTRILIVNQGVEDAFRLELERIAEAHEERILLWSHQPPLLSLAATWNRALDCVWACGGTEALVVNNDVRLHADTVAILSRACADTHALFVSAIGVATEAETLGWSIHPPEWSGRGGPDFSCFLIAKACHDRFRFDEGFTPAFCEDLDYHRRLLLAGEGARIFSIDLPYLHYGSATLKSVDAARRSAIESAISAGSRAHYRRKWGGEVNAETFLNPFGTVVRTDGTATTPYLHAHPPEVPCAQTQDA